MLINNLCITHLTLEIEFMEKIQLLGDFFETIKF